QSRVRRARAHVGRDRRGQPGARGEARDDQRGPVRRGLAGEGQARRTRRSRRPARCVELRGDAVSSYVSATDEDRREMLQAIGVSSIEEMFADIPRELRLSGQLQIDGGLSEQEVLEELTALAARNVSTDDEVSFLGGGMYDHYVPAL